MIALILYKTVYFRRQLDPTPSFLPRRGPYSKSVIPFEFITTAYSFYDAHVPIYYTRSKLCIFKWRTHATPLRTSPFLHRAAEAPTENKTALNVEVIK